MNLSPEAEIAVLKEKSDRLSKDVDRLFQRMKDLEEEVDDLKSWRRWVIGGASAMAVVIGFLASWFKKAMGIP